MNKIIKYAREQSIKKYYIPKLKGYKYKIKNGKVIYFKEEE